MSGAQKRLVLQLVGDEAPPAELPRSGMLVIGSSAEKAGLRVEGQGVADVHCAIGRTKRGGWAVKDLGSDYGTFVNGERVTQARLRAGDQLLVGSRRLKVLDPEAAAGAEEQQRGTEQQRRAKPPAKPASKPAPKKSAEAAAPALPKLPGYRFVRPLGRGAMGAVYLAVQESLDREVALKVLPQRFASDADFVRRFQAEARAAAALNHPNVVTVHDVGQTGGLHYLTMEYMDRGSLEERVARDGPLHWGAVLDVLRDAASGLVYAESRGIVHRDIKPANLMQNHTGATKIADLGLATQVEAESEEPEAGGRKIFGTPHFISPEQVRGIKADCRSDLYSLGATAYRLLSGKTPFEGASTRDILRAKLRDDARAVGELVDDLPEDVERVVMRLMQRDPEERYPSASALLREVEALRSGAAPGGPLVVESKGGAWKLLVGIGAVAAIALFAVLKGGGEADPGPNGTTGPIATGGPDGPADPGPGPTETRPDPTAEPTPGDGTPPRDDDATERIIELEARNAFLELGQRDLARAARRDALRELAEQYRGTTIATEALEEAARIESELKIEAARVNEREQALAAIMGALRTAGGLEGAEPLPAGAALRAMAAVEGQEPFEVDPVFVARREALEDEVVRNALTRLEARLAEAERLESEGRFEELRPILSEILQRTDLPDFEDRRRPKGADRLVTLRLEMREKLDDFDELVATWRAARERDDALAIGRALSGAGGLEPELARLDFAAAGARLAALEERMALEEDRAWVAELRADLERARGVLTALGESFGDWRRKAITDPRGRRGGFTEARGADATGVVLDGAGGTEKVPWSAFGAQTAVLDNLFHERLSRDYSPEERRGIAALLRLSAVAEAARQALEMFSTASDSIFTEGERRELMDAFDEAEAWARKAGTEAALDRERAAAELLAAALRHASEGAWATAVADLERLLGEHGDALLVRLFSDGTGAPVEPAPAVESGEGDEPDTPPDPPPPDDGGDEQDARSGE